MKSTGNWEYGELQGIRIRRDSIQCICKNEQEEEEDWEERAVEFKGKVSSMYVSMNVSLFSFRDTCSDG